MVESKVGVLVKISKANLVRAEKRFDAKEYDSAVFHASMAVETIANALILKLGGSEAKNHRAISGLAAVIRRIKPEWLSEETCRKFIDKGKEIQREVIFARYPLKVGGKWITPMEYYTKEKAKRIISNARFVVEGIEKYLEGKV
jgi:HEPN domain-containing protein